MSTRTYANGVLSAILAAGLGAMIYGAAQKLPSELSATGAALVFVAPLCAALASAVALRWLSLTKKLVVANTVVASALALLGANFYLGIEHLNSVPTAQQERHAAAQKAGRHIDPRTRLEMVTELKQQGIDAVPQVPPRLWNGKRIVVAEPSPIYS